MQHARRVGAAILLLFLCQIGFSQQLRLGNNPYTVEKSAVLELQSTNQGLLFPRIADTLLINALLPPDGMVIYFTTTKQLLLRVNGSWQPLTKGSAISSLNGLTATVQTFATGTAGTDVNIVSSGTAHTFNIPDASATARGLITTTAQTLAGSKTFTAAPVFSSLTQGSIPFIGSGGLVSQNNSSLFWDAVNSRLGIGTTTPSTKLHIAGANPLTLTGVQLGTNTSADSLLTITNGLVRKLPVSTFATSVTTGNLTETGSSILTITGGTGAVVGSGTTLQVKQASASQNGFLSSTDWTTFNNKLSTVDTTNISNFATKTRSLFSAGTGITYNAATGIISSTAASTGWQLLGNAGTVPANHFIGTTDAQPFIIRTNNVERMRVDALGHVGIGSSSFDGTNPEKLLIDAGITTSVNALYAKGSINSYFQINIQNQGTGSQSSSDLVATANNGTETTNFIDVGINGSNYVYQSGNPIETGKANDGYLLSAGSDFYLVNNNSAKDMIFLTGGTATTNEAMRITSGRRLGIGTTAPSTSLHIKTGTANDGGLRMENLTAASTVTTGAAVLGVDATGKVVRAKTPLYYSGTGTTATTEDVTKIWIAEVANNVSGTTTVTIPANVSFATILNIQVSAKSANAVTTAPVVSIVSNTLTSVVVRAMESKTTNILIGGTAEGLEAHIDTNTKIYIRVEGN